jgi:hypothetical protein
MKRMWRTGGTDLLRPTDEPVSPFLRHRSQSPITWSPTSRSPHVAQSRQGRLFHRLPGQPGWLPSRQQPSDDGGKRWHSEEDKEEVSNGDVTEGGDPAIQ